MKVKKYLVNDMKEALYKIKSDLGPEAMIINSRRVRRKGILGLFVKRKLEVTAAVDEPVENENRQELGQAVGAGSITSNTSNDRVLRGEVNSRARAQLAYTNASVEKPVESSFMTNSSTGSTSGSVSGNTSGSSLNSTLGSMLNTTTNSTVSSLPLRNKNVQTTTSDIRLHHELAEVKVLLHRIMRDKDVATQENSFVSRWRQLLLDLEMDQGLVDRLLEDISGQETVRSDRDEVIRVNLANKITRLVEPAYNEISYGKVYAFIGPTGVGKTTTLAKLAAQFTLFHQKQIALITIDTYRIGAVEQLKTYGEIIGVPLEVVMTPEELNKTVMRHQDKDLILIDTAGHPSHKMDKVRELMEFLEVISLPMDVFLVLSATTKNKDLFKCIEEFGKIDINKLIFTKIDETNTLGSMLNVIYHTNLPIHYVTDGQSVPDDIEQVYPKKLAKLLLKGVINQND